MKNKWVIQSVLAMLVNCVWAANAPIQRIDVVNMLGSGGSVSSVVVSFSTGVATPCVTKTLPYLGAMTVWAGTGQACTTPITSVIITPVVVSGNAIYGTTPVLTSVNNTLYSTLITINQATAPAFDPSNGALLIPGTLQALVENHLVN